MLQKNFPYLIIFVGNAVIGYTLNFFWKALPPISCQFDFDVYTLFLSVLIYFSTTIISPILVCDKFSRNNSLEHLSKVISYISVFSWIPLILSSTYFLHNFSFGKIASFASFAFFGVGTGLLQSILYFFTYISPIFKNYEESSAILNFSFLTGILFSDFILFLTNWQISSFVGFYISYFYCSLLMKLFESQKDGKNSLQLPPAMQISIDISSTSSSPFKLTSFCNNYLFIFMLSFVKYFSGKCFFEHFFADFIFELNYSQLILNFIFFAGSILSLLISKYFRFKQTFPLTSTFSIISISIISYFVFHQNKYEWNLTQLFLILSIIAWCIMYTMNFMMFPYVKICEVFKKSTPSIQRSFLFSSSDWFVRLLSQLFYFYIGNYISDDKQKISIICFMNILCVSIGYALIMKKKEISDDLGQAKPLRNL